MQAHPDQVEAPEPNRPDDASAAQAEDASFAPIRFGALKHNITTHWKVEERSHGQ